MKAISGLASRIFHLVMSVKATNYLHNRMLESVLRAKMEFFESTPIGRIINR